MYKLPKIACRFSQHRNHSHSPKNYNSNYLSYLKSIGIVALGAFLGYCVLKYKNHIPKPIHQPKINLIDSGDSDEPPKKLNFAMLSKTNFEDSMRSKFNFIDKVVKKCAPSVFHILLRDAKNVDEKTGEATPYVYGSGFVISEDGWALTNAHVVLNKESIITCKMLDGKYYNAQVQDIDVNMDIALLKIETPEKLPILQFGTPGDYNVGEWVIAMGNPLSLSNSVSVGVISSVNRSAKDLGLTNYSMSYIQTDALITFGNSGGPLVNLDGHVIGINSLRLTSGIAFAIPVDFCEKFLDKSRPFGNKIVTLSQESMQLFGITTIPVNRDLIIDLLHNDMSIPRDIGEGLLIWKILEGSFAKSCGLEAGDIITHINGVPARVPADLYNLSKQHPLSLDIIHNGARKKIVLQAK